MWLMLKRARAYAHSKSWFRFLVFSLENLVSAVIPSSTLVKVDEEPRFFLSAMIRVKDEAPFIAEWIAHHHGLGVQHIYVYDNGSTDGTADVIAPFIRAGLVTLVDWPQRPISPSAERHFLDTWASDSVWVAYLDADEFIRVDGVDLCEFLAARHDLPALALNWRYFGSSHLDHVPDGLVAEAFVWADAHLDSHVKVIARTESIRRYRNPHNFLYRSARLARGVSGQRVIASFCTPKSDALVTIDHYVYRGRSDYVRKVARGFAEARGEDDNARRLERSDTAFRAHNEIVVAPQPERLAKTRSILRSLGYEN